MKSQASKKTLRKEKICFFSTFPNYFPIEFFDSHKLTHYHTMPHFNALKIYRCGKHCEKKLLVTSNFSFSHNVFYPTEHLFSILNALKMWSAICFNLDQSEILSSGNGLRNGIVTYWFHFFFHHTTRCKTARN